ncbi:hypothetical protein BJ878DRAFT_487945 [Calycina marina]|uniref:Protein kinase domain-containing protein n=1 Tax=Calycina marina TaxID=1763456 RepID=A0A9P8CIJ6_9HELO|nr:hypothetical protein BJ878DRAFT_487945 [Calycina marina]
MAQPERLIERAASADRRTLWSWRKLFGKDERNNAVQSAALEDTSRPGLARRLSRKVVPGLPRPGTFQRQQSELRNRLEPIKLNSEDRRTVSMDRRRAASASVRAGSVVGPPRLSAPELLETKPTIDAMLDPSITVTSNNIQDAEVQGFLDVSKETDAISISTAAFDETILEELENRWILNLSMHFRDKSPREKFFVTYAETPSHWRRVTISLDYRNADPGSLEEELQKTRFQRDKSARIYEAIRESLPDIQFYGTVTNLKLQTENERLHVHVVEDLSEIIHYPPVRAIGHLKCRQVKEDQLVFDSHLSGFVYKVKVDNEVFIKKEIPGPDTVDEFLYEINALHRLAGSQSVIQFGGVVLDNKGEYVKGLLISFAEQGALIDVIFDGKGKIPWKRRERWAKQIVQGLAEIHEAGFVQGDFTLSNIVVDGDDNAKIIDINRRGCPVGWEPPEVTALIDSNQRISIYIGVKSDLYQLGMVLYALATHQDEPETQRPLRLDTFSEEIPDYFLDLCQRCLDDDPRRRSQAVVLLKMFPEVEETIHRINEYPIPIVVDARHVDEGHYGQNVLSHEITYDLRKIGSEYSPSSNPHLYAGTDVTDESEYFPRRGRSPRRSPPAPIKEYAHPAELPLPPSNPSSELLQNSHEILVVEDEGRISVLKSIDNQPQVNGVSGMNSTQLPAQDPIGNDEAHTNGQQHMNEVRPAKPGISTHPTEPLHYPSQIETPYNEPKLIPPPDHKELDSSVKAIKIYPLENDLAGVGGAHTACVEKHPANLDAEFTTFTTEMGG